MTTTTVRLAHAKHAAAFSSVAVADEAGYFAQQGLALERIVAENTNAALIGPPVASHEWE